MNNIPKGYKLVPVEPTSEMVLAGINTELVETDDLEFDEQEDYRRVWRSMVEDAPAPPQPIYDEEAERKLFEAVQDEEGGNIDRDSMGYYENPYVQSAWDGWLDCAQSRAKSVEVGNE